MKSASASIQVRASDARDVEALARLAGELGYPCTVNQIRERLESVAGNPHHVTFVAEASGDGVVGWIQLSQVRALEVEPRAEITGLVVDAKHRSAGVGRLLVERGEGWARASGLRVVGVRSNIIRERAHAFYTRLGYAVTKTQKVFRKEL